MKDRKRLYLSAGEIGFLLFAVAETLKMLKSGSQDVRANWLPEVRKDLKEMVTAGNSLLQKISGDVLNGREILYTTDEAKFVSLSVSNLLEMVRGHQRQSYSDQGAEMFAAGNALAVKLNKLGFEVSELPDLAEGEEENYFTKPS